MRLTFCGAVQLIVWAYLWTYSFSICFSNNVSTQGIKILNLCLNFYLKQPDAKKNKQTKTNKKTNQTILVIRKKKQENENETMQRSSRFGARFLRSARKNQHLHYIFT